MEKIEQRYFARNLIVVAAIAEFFSSFTLWLVESPIKYPIFVIETLSIITIYVVLSNYDFEFVLKKIPTRRISLAQFLDIILIYFASVLIVLNQFNITESTTRLVLAFVCTSSLSGYALLNICRLTKYFSKLEIFVLSFLTSFILSGLCTLILLWTDESIRSIVIPFVFIVLGIASFLTHLKIKDASSLKINSLSKNIDILPIALCVAFYAISFYYIYPNFTLLSNTDITRHYRDSILLSRTPDLYSNFNYLLSHAYGSTLNILSGSVSMTSFLNIQPILNIFLPISVYVFTKRFLVNVDKRIPAISIIFFTMMSNFSFIYFIQSKVLGNYGTEINLLRNVANNAYGSSINFIQPFLWFVPLSVSFMMVIFALLLLKVWTIPRSRFIPIFAALVMAMFFAHISEAVIFVSILGIYSMVSKNKLLRLNDALLSSLIALFLIIIIILYISFFWASPLRVPGVRVSSMLPAILSMLLLCTCMVWRRMILHKIVLPIRSVGSKKFYYILSVVMVSVYLLGFLTWFFNSNSSTLLIADTGVVPWFIYPLMLGVVMLLALVAIRHFGHISSNNSLIFFLSLITIIFLMGKAISFVNSNFQVTGYWEKRFVSYIFLFAIPLAPLPLIKLMDRITIKKKFFTTVFLSTIISLIVLLGFSSTVLQLDYWSFATDSSRLISQNDFQAITYLKNVLQNDSHAITFAPSSTSGHILSFAAPPYQLQNPIMIYAKNPEIPLFELNAHNLPHAYIYMHSRDFDTLKGNKNWFTSHLLPTTPVVFSNEDVAIYNVTHVSSPHSNSDNHMLVPTDNHLTTNSLFYAYDIVSKHDTNYTVMFDKDKNALSAKTVVLSYDPPENNTMLDFHDKFTSLGNWKIISGNWDYSTDGLHGRSISKGLNQIISPVSSKNFTLDTSFRIPKTDPVTSSYVSIIYSWMNPKNYKTVDFAVIQQKIYLSFGTIIDSKKYSDSTWPGESTGIKWSPTYLFNMTVSKQGRFEDVFLNGTKYLHREYTSGSGYIGLGYYRINNVVFDHIDIHNLNKLNLRESSDYLSYVKSGGNLIVLNTQGYGSISNSYALFNIGNPPHDVSKIVMVSGDSSPVNISVLPISAVKNVTSLFSYNLPENKPSIFVADKTVGLGKITYVDIYPMISSFNENKTDVATLNTIFEKMSDLINLGKINTNSQRDIVKFNFKEMTGNGNVTIKSESLIFPYDQFTNVIVRNNDKEILMENVTKLDITDYLYAILHTNHISIANGNGLYGNVTLGNSLEISFKNNATLTALSDNNTSSRFDNVSSVLIQNNEPIQAYLWQPEIHVNGNSIFKEFLGEDVPGNLVTKSRTDRNLSGSVSLVLFMSDTYTYGSDISYIHDSSMFVNDSLQKVSQKSKYDEIGSSVWSFIQSDKTSIPILVFGLLFSPFLVAAILLLFGNSKSVKQDGEK